MRGKVWVRRLFYGALLGTALAVAGPFGWAVLLGTIWLTPVALVIWWASNVLGSLRRIEANQRELARLERERLDAH